jgi:ubiquinone/menaquinone biosynthesis C-methylase UbiE
MSDIQENHKRYLERKTLYKSFGYDIEKERKFILDKAQPLYGDILEVGTGKGYMTVALAKEGYNFITIDISKEEQRFARLNVEYLGLGKHVDFRISDAEKMSFQDGSFDVIFSVNTLHHLLSPYKVIDELIRIFSDNGKIILSDFTEKGMEIIDKIHIEEGRRHEPGKTGFREIKEYLSKKGLTIVEHESALQKVLIIKRRNT